MSARSDCGSVVNPDIVKAQIEAGSSSESAARCGARWTLKNGRVEPVQLHDVRVLRMNESPAIEVHLVRKR